MDICPPTISSAIHAFVICTVEKNLFLQELQMQMQFTAPICKQ